MLGASLKIKHSAGDVVYFTLPLAPARQGRGDLEPLTSNLATRNYLLKTLWIPDKTIRE